MNTATTQTTCTCKPCTTPAYGAPYLEHCAACCYGTLVSEYDYDCLVDDHGEIAIKQFGPRVMK